MKFNKETLAGAVFVVFRVLLWLPVLAAAAFFGAALGDLLVSFAAEHLSPAAVGILAGLLTLAVVRSKPPLHTPFERMEQFKQKHHLDRLASFQLEFTLLCMVAFFLSISGIAVFSAAFDSLCAEGLIVPVGWIVCTCLCLFVSSFFIFNLFDLVILWSALSILAVGCALLVSFTSYAVYVPLTAAFGAAALFLGAAAGPAFLKKMEDDAALFCMLRRLRLAEIAVYLLFLLLGQNGMLTLSGLRINLFLTSMIFPCPCCGSKALRMAACVFSLNALRRTIFGAQSMARPRPTALGRSGCRKKNRHSWPKCSGTGPSVWVYVHPRAHSWRLWTPASAVRKTARRCTACICTASCPPLRPVTASCLGGHRMPIRTFSVMHSRFWIRWPGSAKCELSVKFFVRSHPSVSDFVHEGERTTPESQGGEPT